MKLKRGSTRKSTANSNPNLRLIVNALIILAIIIAFSCGGLTEAMAGLLLSRLL